MVAVCYSQVKYRNKKNISVLFLFCHMNDSGVKVFYSIGERRQEVFDKCVCWSIYSNGQTLLYKAHLAGVQLPIIKGIAIGDSYAILHNALFATASGLTSFKLGSMLDL